MKNKYLLVIIVCLMTILTSVLPACNSGRDNSKATSILAEPIRSSTLNSVPQSNDTSITSVSDSSNVIIFPNQSIEVILTDTGYKVVPTVLRAYGGKPQGTAPPEGYSWSVPPGSDFPSGIVVDTKGIVTYTGYQTVQPGSFTINATDGTHTAITKVLVSIEDYRGGPVPQVDLMQCVQELPAAKSGDSYGATISVWGGTLPYTFAIDESSIPAPMDFNSSGLHIDPTTGVIYGNVSPQVAGETLQFKVLITDSTGCTDDNPYTIQVLQ